MEMNQAELISDLISRTQRVIQEVEEFRVMEYAVLNYKPSPDQWSVLECIEHLNRYGDFYLKAIDKAMDRAPQRVNDTFRSGWLGNYFAKMMLPGDKMKPMKTFRDKNPVGSTLSITTVDRFIKQQRLMIDLLTKSPALDISRVRVSISIAPWIKLKLGDVFRVVIYHNQRHVVQAHRVLSKQREAILS